LHRRRWSLEQKRSIIAEAFAPGASVCEVARQRDVRPGQIYRWRRDLRYVATGFAEVVVNAPVGASAVEIELGGDVHVRIAASVPAELARAVIKALVAR